MLCLSLYFLPFSVFPPFLLLTCALSVLVFPSLSLGLSVLCLSSVRHLLFMSHLRFLAVSSCFPGLYFVFAFVLGFQEFCYLPFLSSIFGLMLAFRSGNCLPEQSHITNFKVTLCNFTSTTASKSFCWYNCYRPGICINDCVLELWNCGWRHKMPIST